MKSQLGNAADLFNKNTAEELFQKNTTLTQESVLSKIPSPLASFTNVIRYVTPEEATQWLTERNTHNRAIKKSNLKFIKNEMQRDEFKSLNGQSIVFSKTGRLLDGQHRLQAMSDLNLGYWFNVVNGVPDDYFTTIDKGVKRSNADAFEVKGIKYSKAIAASVGFYLKLLKSPKSVASFGPTGFGINVSDVLNTYESNPDLFQRIYVQNFAYVNTFKVLSAAQLTGIMAYTILESKFGSQAEKEFWEPLFTGENMSDQVKMLRNKLIATLGHITVKTPLNVKMNWIVKVFNSHFLNKPLAQIRYDPNGEFPKII